MGLIITFLLGLFVLAGAAIASFAKNEGWVREASFAVAAGAIVVLPLGDLLPEAAEGAETIGAPASLLAAVIGFVALVVLDRFLPDAPPETLEGHAHGSALHVSVSTAIALSIHNIIEGMSVCGVASESVATAALLAFGVGIHNIPMGMIVASGVRHENTGKRVAVLGAAALSTFVGGLVMTGLGSSVDEGVIAFMLALTIGLLAYILVLELIPHLLRADHKRTALAGFVVGAVIVALGIAIAELA